VFSNENARIGGVFQMVTKSGRVGAQIGLHSGHKGSSEPSADIYDKQPFALSGTFTSKSALLPERTASRPGRRLRCVLSAYSIRSDRFGDRARTAQCP